MKIEQIYTGCLAQGAYYIESQGEVAIIDPLRESASYIDRAKKDHAEIKYVFETHFHADFVSGHVDLAQKTGAQIIYGPTAKPNFECIVAEDNQEFKLGNITIKVLHTPGHTMESSCFLVIDENGKNTALFSGDTLFLGDVGRPDLAQKAASMTQEELAGLLYDSLYNKIIPLEDDITVYPGHGAGSSCGKNMMKETIDTLGHQKEMNYALNQKSKTDFIAAVTDGLLAPPAYFPANVAMNKSNIDTFDFVMKNSLKAWSAQEFKAVAESSNALILDTRSNMIFQKGFIPQSINIGVKGDFAPWVGALIVDTKQPLLIVAEPNEEEDVITRLTRVGFDNILGYLSGGFSAWSQQKFEIDYVNRIHAAQFAQEWTPEKMVIDVRKDSEYAAEHVQDSYHRSLQYINDWIGSIDPSTHFYLHCAGGYRSMMAASILQARGFRNFTEIEGGFNAISTTTIPKTDFVCQSKQFSK
jgi:hydroxyacylglutathione hydrolase